MFQLKNNVVTLRFAQSVVHSSLYIPVQKRFKHNYQVSFKTFSIHGNNHNLITFFQRDTYSGQKKYNLVKPMCIVATDGHIVAIPPPYLGRNNDASMTKHLATVPLQLRDQNQQQGQGPPQGQGQPPQGQGQGPPQGQGQPPQGQGQAPPQGQPPQGQGQAPPQGQGQPLQGQGQAQQGQGQNPGQQGQQQAPLGGFDTE